MRILIILIILAAVAGAGYFAFPKIIPFLIEQPLVTDKLEEIGSLKISKDQAVENVKKLPEVQEYLKNVPNGRVEVDNETEGEYNVHVYEIKNGHSATFNWYTVSIKSGQPEAQFDLGNAEEPSTVKGIVSGKLCYPSEFLPKGIIEAKRISDGDIFAQDYPGSDNGGKSTYSFELEEGDYYLRYSISPQFSGYSTTVCPTGQQESCGDKSMRVLRKAEVKSSKSVTGYDLCDFYYTDSNAPKF